MVEALTMPQLITAAIAILAAVISFISLHRTGKVQRQQLRLQEKQEELVILQLDALKKQAAAPSLAPVQEKADVRVDLESHGRDHRFVITNWGGVPARDVTFELEVADGARTPLVSSDYDEKIPIDELAPGARVPLWAAFTFGMPTSFPARWTWKNPDGSTDSRKTLLAL